jgi:hypothetical protein
MATFGMALSLWSELTSMTPSWGVRKSMILTLASGVMDSSGR